MKEKFKNIHNELESINESLYKGIQLYFSALKESDILFIGINPGAGYFNYKKERVKRFSPLEKFEYVGQKYLLANQTRNIFKDIGLYQAFLNAVKINHFPFATRNEVDLSKLIDKYNVEYKLYYLSKEFVKETIKIVKPKLIICEGKSSFDRLKSILEVESIEYNDNTYILKTDEFVAIGYKRHMSRIKDKRELKDKIYKYYRDYKST